MAVDFIEKKRKQKYLTYVVFGIAIITGLILWFGYFKEPGEEAGSEPVSISTRDVKIDYQVLENPFLKSLTPFEKTPEYEGDLGRIDPFLRPVLSP